VIAARERSVARGLWTLYAIFAIGGVLYLSFALFGARPLRPLQFTLPTAEERITLHPQSGGADALADRRFTRRISAIAAPASTAKTPDLSLEQMVKLTGLLDFGDKKPALAVIEVGGESKAYKAGDKIGETGVVVKAVKEYVVLEFNQRRYKLTFVGAQELPANSVGKD
jgi:hypothetical protein